MSITNKRALSALTILIIIVCIALAAFFGIRHVRSHSQLTKQTPAKLTTAQKQAPHTKIFGNKVVVVIDQSMFVPKDLIITKGSAVVWTNVEATTHQIVTDDAKTITAAKSPVLAQGQSYSHTFTTAGTFKYHCNLHPGMRGTITVK